MAQKIRHYHAGIAVFCISKAHFRPKKQIATAHPVSWFLLCVGRLPLAGLPIAVGKDQIVQITADLIVLHLPYHAPFFRVSTISICDCTPKCNGGVIHFCQEAAEIFYYFAQPPLANRGYTII